MDKILTIIILLFPVFKFFSKEVVKHRKNFKNDDPYDYISDKMGKTFKSIRNDFIKEIEQSINQSKKNSKEKNKKLDDKKLKKNKVYNKNYQKLEENKKSKKEEQISIENFTRDIDKIKKDNFIDNVELKGKDNFEMTEDSLINGIIIKEILDKPLAFRE